MHRRRLRGGTVRALALLTAAAAAAALLATGARGDGSPFAPGLVYGASGVRAPGGTVRYVTLTTPHSTVVAAISIRSGRVVRSSVLKGFYGIPLVAFDNSTGGLSGNRRALVIASYGPAPGSPGSTSFAVLETRTLQSLHTIKLPGSWAFDAISPDASRLYLIEYLSLGVTPHYQVRLYDLARTRLDPKPIVDRREEEVEMRGQPVTRTMTRNGRWAYTLYARSGQPPFIHALDTEHAKAFCVDLPLRLKQLEQMSLRLTLGHGSALRVQNGVRTVAVVDTEKLDARKP
jgi:hypothetical protein